MEILYCVDCCRHIADTGKCYCVVHFFYRKLIVLMADLVAIFGVILISEMKELGA